VQQGLYDPRFEHDACGVGFVARVSAEPSHELLRMALEALSRLAHRGAVAADGRSGDGAGITASIPRLMFASFLADCGFDLAAEVPLGVAMMFVEPEELA